MYTRANSCDLYSIVTYWTIHYLLNLIIFKQVFNFFIWIFTPDVLLKTLNGMILYVIIKLKYLLKHETKSRMDKVINCQYNDHFDKKLYLELTNMDSCRNIKNII